MPAARLSDLIPYFAQPSVTVGPLTIHAFGVIVAMAVLAGLTIGGRRFRRPGLDQALGERLAWWAVVGGFLGAHLFSVLFYFPHELSENPLVLFKLWENISAFGGILGGMIGIWLFFRLRARSVGTATQLAYVDVAAFVFPISLMMGRIGCSLAHDHPGTVTDFPLAVSLESAEARDYIRDVYADAGRLAELPPAPALAQLGFHDLGWYEFLYLAAVVVPVVLLLGRRARAPGFFLAAFVLLYMPVRFVLDFLRVSDVRYEGLTPAQWAAPAALLGLATIIVHGRRRPGAPPAGYTTAPNASVYESPPLDTTQGRT
jgi:phosphatidylglycerol:prolipoprotein diacylglycerol transferase